jgi:hypothetical protein
MIAVFDIVPLFRTTPAVRRHMLAIALSRNEVAEAVF